MLFQHFNMKTTNGIVYIFHPHGCLNLNKPDFKGSVAKSGRQLPSGITGHRHSRRTSVGERPRDRTVGKEGTSDLFRGEMLERAKSPKSRAVSSSV